MNFLFLHLHVSTLIRIQDYMRHHIYKAKKYYKQPMMTVSIREKYIPKNFLNSYQSDFHHFMKKMTSVQQKIFVLSLYRSLAFYILLIKNSIHAWILLPSI